MSIFDGSDKELTFGEALCAIAERVSWPTEAHGIAALRAVQREYDLLPPEPDRKALYNDSRDLTLADQDLEIAKLKKDLEAAKLREQIATANAAAGGAGSTGVPSAGPATEQ